MSRFLWLDFISFAALWLTHVGVWKCSITIRHIAQSKSTTYLFVILGHLDMLLISFVRYKISFTISELHIISWIPHFHPFSFKVSIHYYATSEPPSDWYKNHILLQATVTYDSC